MLKVLDVFTGAAHCWVNSEDGGYYALQGYNVIARCAHDSGCVGSYVHSDSDGLHSVFDYAEGERIADRIMKAGSIDPSKFWDCVSVTDPTDLPDYVLDPDRPEFN